MPPPRVSIIVVTYEAADYIADCLRSIEAGRGRLEVETWVVDNGSRDGTADRVARDFPAARLIRNPGNAGFARAVNAALGSCSGEAVLLLNSDAFLQAGALEAMTAHLEANPRCGVVGAQLIHRDGRLQNSQDVFPTAATVLLNKALLRLLWPRRYPGKDRVGPSPMEAESVIGAAMMFRRSIVAEIGPLDEDYFLFLEETDWCRRAWRKGWMIAVVPAARVVHWQGESRRRMAARGKVEYTRSLLTWFHKRGGRSAAAGIYAGLVLRTLAGWLAATAAAAATLGIVRPLRERWRVQGWLLLWLLMGCPGNMGIRGHDEIVGEKPGSAGRAL